MSGIIVVDDETLFVNWHYLDDYDCGSSSTNPIISAFTTAAHARIELYKYLDILKERTIYSDTDSCCYLASSESEKLPIGPYLGDLTDELDGGYIISFISGGSKFFSYMAKYPDGSEKEVCKLKGVRLDVNIKKVVNHKTVKSLITGEQSQISVSSDAITLTLIRLFSVIVWLCW